MSGLKRFTVSMPAEVYAAADARRIALGYGSVSAYFKFLARQDVTARAAHVRTESEPTNADIARALETGDAVSADRARSAATRKARAVAKSKDGASKA